MRQAELACMLLNRLVQSARVTGVAEFGAVSLSDVTADWKRCGLFTRKLLGSIRSADS